MRSWRTIIPIFLLLALFLMPVTAKTSTASSVWQFSPSMSEHRYGAAVTSSVYGGVFVAGGQIAGTYLSSAEVYVPSTGAWHDIAPMNTPRFQAAATAAGGKIYVLGGYNSTGWLDTVEVYTPATDTWAYITPDMPTARSALAAVTGVDGNIYAIGGYNAGGSLKTVEKYSPATDTWSVVAPLQTARRGLAAVTALNGNIYAIGGTAGVIATASVEAYSIVALHWHYVAALRTPRVDLAADVGSDGLIYAVGGRSSTASSTGLASVEAYATTANTWNFTPSMNLGRYALGAALASDGLIYAVGGASGTVALRSVERYPVAPPATVPGTPSNLQVIPGIGTATVSWTAPYNGGSVITSYVVSAYLGNSNSVAARVTVNGSTTSATLSGLPNGFTYTFGVQAVNAVGAGVEARSGGYTLATIPTAPFNVTALGGIGTLTVSWSTPTSNGGSPLTAYIVTASTGNPAETKVVTVSPAANSVVIGQLIHGRTYTATVAAVNAVGTGPASSPSLPTTLPTVPGPVTNLVVSHGDVSVTAVWQTPTFNGGMPVSSYYVTLSDGVHAAITQV